jgi:hypothetical protein
MINILSDDLFLSQKIKFKKRYSNKQLLLFQYFRAKTKIYPENILIINGIIFFFVKKKDYFRAKLYQHQLRMESKFMKVIIISIEETLIKQIFSFFPDIYIHDIKFSAEENKKCHINIISLSKKEREIAIGNGGMYIDAINEIFKNHIILKGNFANNFKLNIQCNLARSELPWNIF